MSEVIRGEKIERVLRCSSDGRLEPFQEDQSAYQKGLKKGEEEGYDRAKKEFAAFYTLLQSLADKILEHKKHLFQQLKPEIIDFAITLCERVIRQELSQPEKLVRLIDSLLTAATTSINGDMVKIILSPEDLVLIETHRSKIQYDKREIKGLRFVPDPAVRRGDYRIETKRGILNCSIARELEDLRSKVLRQ